MSNIFLKLWFFSMMGISLHELGHHLLGVPSRVSLAHNWPLQPGAQQDPALAIRGGLAGPGINLLLGYLGLMLFLISRRKGWISENGLYLGIANLGLFVVAAVINLAVDLASGTPGNDLQGVSVLLGWPLPVLPAIAVLLSAPPLWYLWRQMSEATSKPLLLIPVYLAAWFLAGLTLMGVDSLLHIRYQIRRF